MVSCDSYWHHTHKTDRPDTQRDTDTDADAHRHRHRHTHTDTDIDTDTDTDSNMIKMMITMKIMMKAQER